MSEWEVEKADEDVARKYPMPPKPLVSKPMTEFLLRTFQCPACGTDVRARDEEEFNSHLDGCLQPERTGSPQVEQRESRLGALPRDEPTQNTVRPTRSEKEGPRSNACDDGLGRSDRQERISGFSSSCVEGKCSTGSLLCGSVSSAAEVADVITSDSVTSSSDQDRQQQHGVSDQVTCPVCSQPIGRSSDVRAVNTHIDECLSVKSLKDLSSCSGDRKRKLDCGANRATKKAKQNSIKSYFATN